jgi:hypothetical protein
MSEKNNPRGGGLFGIDIIPGIDIQDFLPDLPSFVPPAIKDAVELILGPDGPNIGDPQPEGEKPIPVDAGSKELSSAVRAIDGAITSINLLLKFGFLIPDQYESPLRSLAGALGTIRGWLD